MRRLKLTHEEIQIIQESLQYYYNSKLNLIKNNSGLITLEERKLLVNDANKYVGLHSMIEGGEKDV